jgi:hypothetical protein
MDRKYSTQYFFLKVYFFANILCANFPRLIKNVAERRNTGLPGTGFRASRAGTHIAVSGVQTTGRT